MRRIVIDTNVVLAGLLWRGPPYSLLAQVGKTPGMQLFSSQALLNELADVLMRPSPTKRLNQVNLTAHSVLADYVRAVTVLQPQPLPQPVCRDPDDDEVLALALLAQADVIVSGDNDLLVLQSFMGIPIVTAAQALQSVAAA
jgi:uncharacterized protein